MSREILRFIRLAYNIAKTTKPNEASQEAITCQLDKAIALLSQQPEASELTKRLRELIKLSEKHLSNSKIGRLQTYGREVCDFSDLQAEELKDAKQEIERLKETLRNYGSCEQRLKP